MKKQKFEFLCRTVLIPQLNKVLRRHMTSRKFLQELLEALDQRLNVFAAELSNESVRLGKILDQIVQLLRK